MLYSSDRSSVERMFPMLRKSAFLIILIGLISCATASAAPAYGTRQPLKNHFVLGGQSYWVFKRELAVTEGKLKSTQHFMLLSYGIFDWLTLDLKGGAGDIEQTPNTGNSINYPTFVGGGYGFRIKAYERDHFKVVGGFQHISIHPYSVFIGPVKHKAVIDDWQLSFLASYTFKYATPYLGARWSRMDYIHWTEDDRDRVKSNLSKSYGLVIGTDIPLCSKAWVNVEGSFFDSDSVSASINYAF